MALSFILTVALLNIIYTIGFFAVSIWSKVHSRHYFLGYDPKLFTFQIRDVKFSVGIYIPFPVLGRTYIIVDGVKQPAPSPWQYFNVSIARRLLATLAGTLTLAISGWLIFCALSYVYEESIITKEEVNKYGIYPSDEAKQAGFQRGDRVIEVNGKDFMEYRDLLPQSMYSRPTNYTVSRDGREVQISVAPLGDVRGRELFLSLDVPFEVQAVLPESAAAQAGIIKGDRITKANDTLVVSIHDLIAASKSDDDGRVSLVIERQSGDSIQIVTTELVLGDQKMMGIAHNELYDVTIRKNSLAEAIAKGTSISISTMMLEIKALGRLTDGRLEASKSIRGPIQISPVRKTMFWWRTATYALIYAFWNLLPLPLSALWEIIALAYEGVTRRQYSVKAFRVSRNIGWLVAAAWCVWIVIGDLTRLFS